MARLLHISANAFPPLDDEHTTKKIWRELAKGFDEYHILARAKDNRFHNYQEGNIYLHLVPKFGKSRSFFFTSLFMWNIIRRYNINILLSQCPLLGGYVASYIAKVKKIPLMTEIHGMEYFRILDSNKIYNKIASQMMKHTFSNSTKVRSLSKKMTELLHTYKIEANIVEIPNRVNFDLFNSPKTDNKIQGHVKVISVGRFVWEKAYDIAIEAIIELQKKYEIELTLIGGGPLIKEYEELAGRNDKIRLISWLPQEDFIPMLNQSDIYIQPSVSEGMPRTILEAMAMRLPVIASDVGAISGVIRNRENGILISPKSIESLKTAIEELINDSTLRSSIAENGYQDALSNYEWNSAFEKYRAELNDMVN